MHTLNESTVNQRIINAITLLEQRHIITRRGVIISHAYASPSISSPLMAQRLFEEIIRDEVDRLAELSSDVRSVGGDFYERAGLGDSSR